MTDKKAPVVDIGTSKKSRYSNIRSSGNQTGLKIKFSNEDTVSDIEGGNSSISKRSFWENPWIVGLGVGIAILILTIIVHQLKFL